MSSHLVHTIHSALVGTVVLVAAVALFLAIRRGPRRAAPPAESRGNSWAPSANSMPVFLETALLLIDGDVNFADDEADFSESDDAQLVEVDSAARDDR